MNDDHRSTDDRKRVVIRIEVDPRIVRAARAAMAPFRRRRLAVWAGLGALGLALYAAAQPATPPHTFEPGTPIRAADVNESFEHLYDALNERVIHEPETWPVTADEGCEGLVAALQRLDGRTIASTATVTIELEPGTYACADTLHISHPDGQRLHITGGGGAPEDVILTFPGTGISVAPGSHLGNLAKLTLQGSGGSTQGDSQGLLVSWAASAEAHEVVAREFNGNGFVAAASSTLRVHSSAALENLRAGLWANNGSRLIMFAPFLAEGNGDHGLAATNGSFIRCSNVGDDRIIASQGNDRDGLFINAGSVVECILHADENGRAGVHVLGGSVLTVGSNASFSGNATHGIVVGNSRVGLRGSGTAIESNGGFGVGVSDGSTALVPEEISVTENAGGDFNIAVNTLTLNGTLHR